ncbi:hypothetical protein LguiA_030767 [Lonicera macranthoides]
MNSPHFLTLHFAILVLLFTSIPHAVDSTIPSIQTDKEALISFKSQLTTEPPNDALLRWDQNLSPCNWTRVLCNRERVIGLDLSGLKLAGSISPHIGNLSFLASLQLQSNQLTGKIPNQLGNLFRLRVLNMSFNNLEGTIPSNLSHCRKLETLDLMQNKIYGTIPQELSQLTNLQVLNLARNHLIGTIPSSIGNLSSLTVLNLGTNTIGGTIPDDLARLRNLKELDLTINNLTGTIPPSIYNMSSLVSLALASNYLRGEIPENIGVTLPNLLVFKFCINKFTGMIPGSLHNLTRIQIIRMAHNFLHGTVPPGLENLRDLHMYNIGYNNIVSGHDGLSFLKSFANSTRLDYLAIDGNLLEGVIPESIGNLPKSLTKLYMGENRISGSIPASIGALSGLALLNLSHNSLSGEIPPQMGELKELQMLCLARNRLSGQIPNSLGNLRKMNQIDLSANELVGSIPTTFESFQNLLSMDLSNNKLNGSIPKEVLNLPSLSTFLNFSKNCLTGPLPQEVGLLESVAAINLSHNRFSGSIPTAIEKCKSLEELFIADNIFSGPIPDSFGTLNGLVALDLSSNKLSGVIPTDLQKLRALQFLNLSFNNLEGQVPKSGVFANLSKVHLEGNPKLCSKMAFKNSQGHKGRLILVSITVAMAVIIALCLAIGLLFYIRKGKAKDLQKRSESFKGEHRMVTFDELRRATENFNQENLIGQGSFGSVYMGCLRGGFAIAAKVFDVERTGYLKSFFAECAALRHVRHRNLVKLITSCSSIDSKNKEFLALVYEFMSKGSLEDWITGKRRNPNGSGLNMLDRLSVVIDVASALNYLHHECEDPVVHCDLKPSNVLLAEVMTAKVGDFGLARLLSKRNEDQPFINSTNALRGSIEYGMGAKPSTAGDVYSFGIMLMELFTGKSPTDESFVGGLSLKSWVQRAFPTEVKQVLDPHLFLQMGNSGQEDQSVCRDVQHDGLITVIGVGLSCTVESPEGRISMRDALHKLKSIRDSFLKPHVTKKLDF